MFNSFLIPFRPLALSLRRPRAGGAVDEGREGEGLEGIAAKGGGHIC